LYPVIADGNHTVDVRATDNASNSVIASIGFMVDTTPPSIDEIWLELTEANGTARLGWIASDATSGVAYCLIHLNDEAWQEIFQSWKNYTDLPDGEYQFHIRAVDNAGNMGGITMMGWTIDRMAPEVVDHFPTGENISIDTPISVEFSEPMNESSVTIIIASIAGHVEWDGNTATFIPDAGLQRATAYSVFVDGTDRHGNPMDTYQWSFNTTDLALVTGTVVDEHGHPVPNATITLDTGENTTTDVNGNFSIEVAPGNHTITIHEDGYADRILELDLAPGQVDSLGSIVLSGEPDESWINVFFQALILIGFICLLVGIFITIGNLRRK